MSAWRRGVVGSHHLVIWLRVTRKPKYTGLIKNLKGKRLIVAREGISIPGVPYLR
jgi:hypothetical protein